MNLESVSQAFFDERLMMGGGSAPPATVVDGNATGDRRVDLLAAATLIAALESACMRVLRPFVAEECEAIAGAGVECHHHAPVPAGVQIRLVGWVESLSASEIAFRVQAHDEHEALCDGTIRLAVVDRARLEARAARKAEALARRASFAPA